MVRKLDPTWGWNDPKSTAVDLSTSDMTRLDLTAACRLESTSNNLRCSEEGPDHGPSRPRGLKETADPIVLQYFLYFSSVCINNKGNQRWQKNFQNGDNKNLWAKRAEKNVLTVVCRISKSFTLENRKFSLKNFWRNLQIPIEARALSFSLTRLMDDQAPLFRSYDKLCEHYTYTWNDL